MYSKYLLLMTSLSVDWIGQLPWQQLYLLIPDGVDTKLEQLKVNKKSS